MNPGHNHLSPAQRLQASRHAITTHLQSRRGRAREPQPEGAAPRAGDSPPRRGSPGWLRMARHALRVWWQGHPAYSAALVARPVLADYARHKPVQVLGIAAALGAAVVVLRPWRLISVGALVAATLRSQDTSRLVMSFLAQAMPQDREDDAP